MSTFDLSHLSEQERIDLIGDLCDSLNGEAWPITAAQRAELERRNDSFSQERQQAVPWATVRAKLRPVRAFSSC